MTGKILLFTTILSLVLFTGCSQKSPKLKNMGKGNSNISDATQIVGETVSINEDPYGNQNGKNNGQNASDDESNNNSNGQGGTNNGKYNSSSNGFQSIYFDFGGYGISPDMDNGIAKNVQALNNTNARVKIEGNCDEFGTDEYNYALGLKRAKAVKDALVSQGISANKMVIISFGESNPVCSNPTDGCYSQNRRVDLHLAK